MSTNTSPAGSGSVTDLLDMDDAKSKSSTSISDLISQTTSKLKNVKEDDIETRNRILAATLEDVPRITAATKSDLKSNLDELFNFLDSIGLQFDGFKKFNDTEQGIIDTAEGAKTAAQETFNNAVILLKQKEDIEDTWWERLWGRASKIQKAKVARDAAKTALTLAEERIKAAKNEAEIMFRQRLETSDMQEYMDHVAVLSEKCIQLMKKRMEELSEDSAAIEAVLQEGNKTLILATQKKAEAEQKAIDVNGLITQETEALGNIKDTQSDAYAKQSTKIRELQRELEEWNGKVFVADSIIKSKESFELKQQQALIAIATLKNNIKAMQAKLKSDSEARPSVYAGYLTAIKAANDQKLASQLDETGRKTDENVATNFAEIAVGADKARQDMMTRVPKHNEHLFEIIGAMQEAREISRKRDLELAEMIEKGFGEGTYKLFNPSYSSEPENNASNGAQPANGGGAASGGNGSSSDLLN